MVAVSLLLAGAAMAQTSGCAWVDSGYAPPGPGGVNPYAGLTPGAQQRIADLGRQIARAQRELWSLQEQGADWRTVSAKRNEVLCLRYELARYLTDLPAWSDTVLTGVEPPPPPPPTCAAATPPPPLPPRPPCAVSQAPVYRPPSAYRPPWACAVRPPSLAGQQQQGGQQQQQSGGGQQQQQQ